MQTKERIKVLPDKSSYLLTSSGYWVRDFTRSGGKDINELYDLNSVRQCIENETYIRGMNLPGIDRETNFISDVAIVSDGYDLLSCPSLINTFGKAGVKFIGVNGVLTGSIVVKPNFYLINCPTADCMSWLPNKTPILPPLITSVRTYPEFVRRYKSKRGVAYSYVPVGSMKFLSKMFSPAFTVDDYRNPICAAINLAFRWGASRIWLFAPHDLFPENRPGTQKTESGLYIYPQQVIAHNFIDGCLYWVNKHNDCEIYAVTSGPAFKNAETISPARALEILNRK